MTPYEILLSESQERMLLVARAGREAEVERIFQKWDLDASAIGKVTTDGLLRVFSARAGGRGSSGSRPRRRRTGLRTASRPARLPRSHRGRARRRPPGAAGSRSDSRRRFSRATPSRASTGSSSSTITWCGATPSCFPEGMPAWSGSKGRRWRSRCASTETAATPTSIRTTAGPRRSRRAAAISPRSVRPPSAPRTASTSAIPRNPRSCGSSRT